MRIGVKVVAVASVGFLSGCAGFASGKQVTRLQSRVNILEERMAQLERSSFGTTPIASVTDSIGALAPTGSPFGASASESAMTSKGAGTSSKPSTREIQQALRNAGFYNGPIDGKNGPLTRSAIREFQQAHGLQADGVVGSRSWDRLRTYATLGTDEPGLDASVVLK